MRIKRFLASLVATAILVGTPAVAFASGCHTNPQGTIHCTKKKA